MSLLCTTKIPIDLRGLISSADNEALGADPVFSFLLCHEGVNGNGDNFTTDEIRQAYQTAVGQKVNLSHSQKMTDIVGGITTSKLVNDKKRLGIACEAELFPAESQQAALAYKLLKKGIVGHVSMECEYKTGTCSVCGKTVASKADYCVHLKNYKGREYQGNPVFETLHGVRFSGLGLLSKMGADPDARITQVANNINGGETLADGMNPDEKPGNQTPENQPNSDQETIRLNAIISQLKQENQSLKDANSHSETQIQELKKRLSEFEAKEQAFAKKQRAETLMATITKKGFAFATDTAKADELSRLSALDDNAFAVAEQTYALLVGRPDAKPKTPSPTATETVPNQSQASFRPADVEDTPPTDLETDLTNHLMAAWQSRHA